MNIHAAFLVMCCIWVLLIFKKWYDMKFAWYEYVQGKEMVGIWSEDGLLGAGCRNQSSEWYFLSHN